MSEKSVFDLEIVCKHNGAFWEVMGYNQNKLIVNGRDFNVEDAYKKLRRGLVNVGYHDACVDDLIHQTKMKEE